MTNRPTPARCTDPCIACMTDESHDPAPPSIPAETGEQRAQPAASSLSVNTAERRDQYAAAMARRDGHPEWPPQYEDDERDYWRRADAAMAVADAEQAAEIAHLRGLLASESKRANDAIDREEIAEQAAEEAPADLTPYRRLLARLEADRAGHLRAAGQATDGRLRDVGSSYAAALHHAATLAVVEFEGAEAAREYAAENTKLHQGQDDDRVASAPAATDLRERVARAIADVFDRWRDGLDDQRPEDAIRDAVLAVFTAPADRAAEWRTAADMIDAEYPGPETSPLLFWDQSAGVVYEDGRITTWISRAIDLAQSAPAGQLILQIRAAQALRRALTTALNDADEAQQAGEDQ